MLHCHPVARDGEEKKKACSFINKSPFQLLTINIKLTSEIPKNQSNNPPFIACSFEESSFLLRRRQPANQSSPSAAALRSVQACKPDAAPLRQLITSLNGGPVSVRKAAVAAAFDGVGRQVERTEGVVVKGEGGGGNLRL